jgi:hypothetical protein
VGTQSNQNWTGGAIFDVTGGDAVGTVFGNGNLSIGGTSNIDGDASFAGTIDDPGANSVNGTKTENHAPYTFPDQDAVIDAAVATAQGGSPIGGAWLDPRDASSFTVSGAPPTIEVLNANVSKMGSGWNSTNTPYMTHFAVKGTGSVAGGDQSVIEFDAGNLAFGRLWIENATVIVKTPPGGGTFALTDIQLFNNARLIFDASDGKATVVTGSNNAFDSSTDVGTTSPKRYDNSTQTFDALADTSTFMKFHGSASSNQWHKSAANSGSAPKDSGRGTTSGYDDWQILDSSILATVTASPNDKGIEMYSQNGNDLVVDGNSAVMSGLSDVDGDGDVDAADQTLLRKGDLTAVLAAPQNAIGFIAWSAGGELPRFDVGEGGGGGSSGVTGLFYGGWEGNLGPQGKLIGAFVGQDMDSKGAVYYDARLATLLTSARKNSEHVVFKRQLR